MNVGDFSGKLRNYNGEGRWSVEAVQERYREYCATLHIERSRTLSPREHREGDTQWFYPIMEEVIGGIEERTTSRVSLWESISWKKTPASRLALR